MRSRLGLGALVIVLAIAGCGDETAVDTTAATTATTAATPTSSAPSSSSTSPADPWIETEEVVVTGSGEHTALLYRPAVAPDDSAPLVVMFHGASDDPSTMSAMAEILAGDGAVVLSAYTAVAEGTGGTQIPDLMPLALDDAVCALGHAVENASEWGADARTLTVVGHSAGADVGIYVSLSPASFDSVCDPSDIDVFAYVGLAADPESMSEGGGNYPFIEPYPDLVDLLEPYQYLDGNRDLVVRFANSVDDPFRSPRGAEGFVAAALADGMDADLLLLEGRSHTAPRTPNTGSGMEVIELIRSLLGLG